MIPLYGVVSLLGFLFTIRSDIKNDNKKITIEVYNRRFSYSTKEPGSSVIFIHFTHDVRSSGIELLSQWCSFENSTLCSKTSFDFGFFSE